MNQHMYMNPTWRNTLPIPLCAGSLCYIGAAVIAPAVAGYGSLAGAALLFWIPLPALLFRRKGNRSAYLRYEQGREAFWMGWSNPATRQRISFLLGLSGIWLSLSTAAGILWQWFV